MAVSKKVAELAGVFESDNAASWVVNIWDNYHQQRSGKVEEWNELRNYLFATDTTTTTNATLPWKNSTTLPKLCQLRDNLHSNYLSSLFPNDRWLSWQGASKSDSTRAKAKAIKAYMGNKCKHSHFRTEYSKLLYDYIDYGNAFVTVDYENSTKENVDGDIITNYIGPVARRISPLDIVFNPLASNFRDTFKIVRSIKTIGEIKVMAENSAEDTFWKTAIERRERIAAKSKGYTVEDFNKAAGFTVDGFGNLHEYYQSGYVEILEFYGDYHDANTGELKTNQIITVMDRSTVVSQRDIPSWLGHAPIYHVGWRFRPDNLWAMGPLDNLVGMQYRIDHLENLKADAMDLCVHPPLVLQGEVEEFQWGPGVRIHIDADGQVGELGKNLNGIVTAANEISILEDRMELYAGAPREAMGVRTPGEKTALEVQTLSNAASRIFQEKITNFEIELLEPCLNAMLETAIRNMTASDVVRTIDDDLGVTEFMTVTRSDLTASGVLMPIGARHFAKQAQDLQNLIGILNSPIGAKIMPHTSGIGLSKFVEDVVNLGGYEIFKPNVSIPEDAETQALISQAQEDLQVESSMPAEV